MKHKKPENVVTKIDARARHKARRLAVQALFQWNFTGEDIKTIEQQFGEEKGMKGVDIHYFHDLIYKVPTHQVELDELFTKYLDRAIDELNPVELAVIRIACYELKFRSEIPYRVVINEALELNKVYGAEDGYKYVNGVLDKVAHELRSSEIKDE